MKLTIHEIAQVVGAKNDISIFEDTQLEKAEFDSRLIGTGDLFVPLKGARDGHDFIETAFENGAAVTLSEKEVSNHPYILVDDVLTAFQSLASYYLEKRLLMSLLLQVQMARQRPRICWRIYCQRPTRPTKHKATTITRLAFPTQFYTCLKEQKSWFWRWGRTTWAIFISCLNWLVQKQPS